MYVLKYTEMIIYLSVYSHYIATDFKNVMAICKATMHACMSCDLGTCKARLTIINRYSSNSQHIATYIAKPSLLHNS